jgi:hypothetical protein
MAALIGEARAARQESQRLRADMVGLKLSMREQNGTTRKSLAAAEQTVHRLQARRAEPVPSPWSTLPWGYADPALHSVLVPVA